MEELMEKESILDILLDEDNKEPLVLTSEDQRLTFEQVAVIPFDEKVYAILKPVDPIDGIAEDEAVVFFVDEEHDSLQVEDNEEKAKAVFDEYYRLLEELEKESEK
jgi:hypothetical protein